MFWNDPRFARAMFIFGCLMIGVYIFAGIYLIYSDKFWYIPETMRVIFGIFLIVYGIFRAVRVYYKNKYQQSAED